MSTTKKPSAKSTRQDPKQNKSLAIRNTLAKHPSAKAAEIVATVKKEYGHDVSINMVYMVKAKSQMRRTSKKQGTTVKSSPVGAAQWVEAIKIARQLLKATGNIENATALLRAVEG